MTITEIEPVLRARVAARYAPTITDRFMAEHVLVPGMPQVIVTRGFLAGWLRRSGAVTDKTGYGSIDYMAFGRHKTDEPLTPEPERDRLLAILSAHIAKERQ